MKCKTEVHTKMLTHKRALEKERFLLTNDKYVTGYAVNFRAIRQKSEDNHQTIYP